MNLRSDLKAFGLFVIVSACGLSLGNAQSTYFVFTNDTGLPDSAVYIDLTNALNTEDLQGGDTSTGSLTLGGTYSLAQLEGNLPGTSDPALQNVPIVSALQYANGGRIFITLGQGFAGTTGTPSNSIVSGLVEPFIDPTTNSGHQNNVDVSYVNGVSLPVSISVNNRSDGTAITGFNTINPIATTPGTAIYNGVTASPVVTSGAINLANYQAVNSSGGVVGNITGTATLTSPASGSTAGYHDWTSSGDYVPYLESLPGNEGTINVASYNVPAGSAPLAGVEFGFSTVTPSAGAQSPFGSNDPNNEFLAGQSYNFTATFTNNLNPTSNSFLSGLGITPGTAGVAMTGTASVTGSFVVYITNSQLNSSTGIYGGNPAYVASWQPTVNGTMSPTNPTYYVSSTGSDNLVARMIGDLSASLQFGQAGSQTVIGTNAPSTQGNLAGSIFATTLSGSTVGSLSTGEYFYLLSLMQNGSQVGAWSGSSLQSNPLFYDSYGNGAGPFTDAYTYAYSDRLQGQFNPDLYFYPNNYTVGLDDLYIDVTLEPGAYTFTAVPEPSVFWLMPLLLVGMALLRLRTRRAV